MKVFVDANTIVSGLLFVGNDAVLLELGRLRALRLVTNEYVFGEVREILKRGGNFVSRRKNGNV